METFYSIGEVAKIFNITTNRVRFYEKKGLIIPKRDEFKKYNRELKVTRIDELVFIVLAK